MGQFLSSTSKSTRRVLTHKTEANVSDSTSDLGHSQCPVDGLSVLARAKGHYWYPSDGPKILDACGGAGVACLGHGRKDIIKAVNTQMKAYSYTSYAHFKAGPVQELSDWLIKSTGGKMQKAYIMCSGKDTPSPCYPAQALTTPQARRQSKPPSSSPSSTSSGRANPPAQTSLHARNHITAPPSGPCPAPATSLVASPSNPSSSLTASTASPPATPTASA